MASSREKIEQSFALLQSLWVATQDASSAASAHNRGQPVVGGQALPASMATFHGGRDRGAIDPALSSSPSNKSIFPSPRRAPVLDKIAKLTTKRPSLQDSIAASITASASVTRRTPDQSQAMSLAVPSTTSLHSTKSAPSAGSRSSRYMPWSREQFHERLSTFKPSTWFDKPRMVNPVECAKYGWMNKGDDRLECFGGCGAVVIMRAGVERSPITTSAPTAKDTESRPLEPQESQAESLVAKEEEEDDDIDFDTEALGPHFHAMLTSSHAKACPWKNHPCDDNIYKFPVLSRTQAKAEFMERLSGLEAMRDDPLVAKIHHTLTSDELGALKAAFPSHSETALVLGLYGWQQMQSDIYGNHVRRVIGCTACHTQCTFVPPASATVSNSLATIDDDQELGDEEPEDGFHVLGSHRWYCYWVDPVKSQEPGKEGWRVLFDALVGSTRTETKDDVPDPQGRIAKKPRLEPREALAHVKRILRHGGVP